MTNENVLLGTDIKLKVELTCEGFSMDANDFDLTVRWNGGSKTYKKTSSSTDGNIVEAPDGSGWYLVIETEKLSMKGLVTLIATLYVPDTDFPDKIRSEVVKQDLFSVKRA